MKLFQRVPNVKLLVGCVFLGCVFGSRVLEIGVSEFLIADIFNLYAKG